MAVYIKNTSLPVQVSGLSLDPMNNLNTNLNDINGLYLDQLNGGLKVSVQNGMIQTSIANTPNVNVTSIPPIAVSNTGFNCTNLPVSTVGSNNVVLTEDPRMGFDSNTNLKVVTPSNHSSACVFNNIILAQNTTSTSLSTSNNRYLSVFGSVTGITTSVCGLSLQYSTDNVNFFTTQYSISLTGSTQFGFTIPCSASYVRLIQNLANCASTCNAYIEAT